MLSSEVYQQIVRFIDDELSIDELREWYAPRYRKYLKSDIPGDRSAISAIALALADFDNGIIDQEGVKSDLHLLIQDTPIVKVCVPEISISGEPHVRTYVGQSSRHNNYESLRVPGVAKERFVFTLDSPADDSIVEYPQRQRGQMATIYV